MERLPSIEKEPVHLRHADETDIPLLIDLGKNVASRLFHPLLEEEGWRKEIETNVVYLIEKGDSAVGRISYEFKGPKHVEINGVVVDPQFQGQGVARAALLKYCKSSLRWIASTSPFILTTNQRSPSMSRLDSL